MRVLVLGGDGFCGWPTALHLSDKGHEVVIVDNLSRRNIDNELEVSSLTPIAPMGTRLKAWQEVSGKEIVFHRFDVAENYHRLLTLLQEFQPEAVVHFAEQRAAPYSMKSSWHKRYTVSNNLNATNNLLAAIVESGPGHPRRPPRDDGRLRLRHGRDEDPRGLPAGQARDRRRRDDRAGDPVPAEPRQHLPPDQDAGPAAVRLLRQERQAARHRPAPGHRVGHPDRSRPSRTSG